jgi:thymidine phosphorylase
MLAQEIIARKRDGHRLSAAEIDHFVAGVVSGAWSEGQIAALAMAIVCRGMQSDETVQLTHAMTQSGEVLDWSASGLSGPVLDKHSTGGVGDKVSLMLAPMLAACGGIVPMISGRGLGHTGGTLDKLESLPGYDVNPSREALAAALKLAGCAIVAANDRLAPADRRLYAIRDVTATVESVPLITASILSKKLAAGLGSLVMDVKVGNGAFMPTLEQARGLAESLVRVARGAGLPTVALLTDMNQPLGCNIGNALEVAEAIDFLTGRTQDPRLLEVTAALCAEGLVLAEIASDPAQATALVQRALSSGAAAECWAKMVAALGGPRDVLRQAQLPSAPVQLDLRSTHNGWVDAIDTRALGLAVVELGGGRRRPSDPIDPRVGLTRVLPVGSRVEMGQTLACIHADSADAAQVAARRLLLAFKVSEQALVGLPRPVIHAVIGSTP